MNKPDSLIFDMDGTLWDAVETYVASFNEGYKTMKINKLMTREDLGIMMGWEKRKVLAYALPEYDFETQDKIYEEINKARAKLIPELGGILYEGVKKGLARLSTRYKLFIVSNCPEHVIRYFMRWADIEEYITDEMAHGVNSMPKNHNIKILIERHNLQNPVYIGDTETDSLESKLAGLPFIFLSYGFGKTEDYDLKFENFDQFTEHFMQLG